MNAASENATCRLANFTQAATTISEPLFLPSAHRPLLNDNATFHADDTSHIIIRYILYYKNGIPYIIKRHISHHKTAYPILYIRYKPEQARRQRDYPTPYSATSAPTSPLTTTKNGKQSVQKWIFMLIKIDLLHILSSIARSL